MASYVFDEEANKIDLIPLDDIFVATLLPGTDWKVSRCAVQL